jgi:hypothetical protein
MKLRLFIALIIYSSSGWAQNFDICDTILRGANVGCQDRALSNTMGGSYATIFYAINVNPASAPIYKTPVGLEYTNTKGQGNFVMIKGRNGWGGEQNLVGGFGESYKNKHELFGASFRPMDWVGVGYFYNDQLISDSSLVVQLFLPIFF